MSLAARLDEHPDVHIPPQRWPARWGRQASDDGFAHPPQQRPVRTQILPPVVLVANVGGDASQDRSIEATPEVVAATFSDTRGRLMDLLRDDLQRLPRYLGPRL